MSIPCIIYSGRIVHRGGGADVSEWLAAKNGATNCYTFCNATMRPQGMRQPGDLCDPHFVKCYENATSGSPPNSKRFAFPSQIGTSQIDPALPQMLPITAVNACLRI